MLPRFPSYLPSFLYRSGCLSSIIFSAYNISFIIFANLLLNNSLSFCLPEIFIYLYFSIIFEEYFVDMGFTHCVSILFNVDYVCKSCLNYSPISLDSLFSQLRIIFSHFFACLVNFILSWALWILRYRKSRLLLFFHLKGVEFCSGRQFIYWKSTLISLGLILFYFFDGSVFISHLVLGHGLCSGAGVSNIQPVSAPSVFADKVVLEHRGGHLLVHCL